MPDMVPYNVMEGGRVEQNIPMDDGTSERVSIVIVHKDRPEYLNIALQSIAVTSLNNNFEVVVVDNASGQESQDYLDSIEGEVKVVRNDKNVWWAKAANQGAKAADPAAKYLLFLHHDVVIENPGWLDLLIGVSTSKKSGLVGIEMSHYGVQDRKVDFITETCVLLTAECFKECGGWNEELPQVGAPFVMTYAAQLKGFNPQVVKNKILHHYGVFAMDYSEYERFSLSARATIPGILRELQGMPRKK